MDKPVMTAAELISLMKEIRDLKQEEARENEDAVNSGTSSDRVHGLEDKVRSLGRSAVPLLRDALRICSEGESSDLAEACVLLGPAAADAVPCWFEAALDGRGRERLWYAIRGLLRDDPWPAGAPHAPLIRKCVNGISASVGESAVFALRAIGPAADETVRAGLIEALADRYTRRNAAVALGRMGPAAAAAVPGLVTMLETSDAGPACEALIAIGVREAAKHLPKALDCPNRHARLWGSKALAELGSASDIPALQELLSREWAPEVREAAASAILKLRGEPPCPDGLRTIDAAHPPKGAVAKILRRLASSHDLDLLDGLQGLQCLPDRPVAAVPLLAQMLKKKLAVDGVVAILKSYGPAAAGAVPALVNEMFDGTTGCQRERAAEALGDVAGPEAIEALQEYIKRAKAGGVERICRAAIDAIRVRHPKG